MKKPTKAQVAAARAEIQREDEDRERRAKARAGRWRREAAKRDRGRALPSEDPDHTCGVLCDGQDGPSSRCYRLRAKLGFHGGGS